MNILAAIVTYNRCDLLARCIDHVQGQSRQPDTLLVINNGSTDDTVPMLEARGVTFVTQDNVGSAGGWHRAIQYAVDEGVDAVWLMDDDGYPDSEALDKLERALKQPVACASSVVLREDRPTHFVFPFPVLDDDGLPVIFGWPRKLATLQELRARSPSSFYPFAHLFNGALFSIDAIRQVGNVNREYFIYGEEVDFYFRLRRAAPIISVLDAFHFHPDVSNRPYNLVKVYYYIKNALILNARHYNYVWLRHAFMLGMIFYRLIKRNGLRFALSLLFGAHSAVSFAAVSRGLQGRIGRDYDG